MRKSICIFALLACSMLGNLLCAQEYFPNKEQRIYSLSLIWKELDYNFAFPEKLKQANLDSLYMAYLPKIENASDNYEYYRTLCAFMANFNEAHTRIFPSERPDDIPPLLTTNFGERIVVSNVAKSLADEIPVGSEILLVDSIPAARYVKDSIYQFIAAATPHWKFDKAVTEMLYGKPLTAVSLVIKTPKGKEQEVNLIRNYYSNGGKEEMAVSTNLPPINIKVIDNKIGYIQLNSFAGSTVNNIKSVFSSYLPQLKKCKGLIIDIRGNRGGTDEAWENLAYYLMPESQFQIPMKYYSRKSVATLKNWGMYDPNFSSYYQGTAMGEITHNPYENKLNDSLKLHQPLVILSGQYVGSATEDFLSLMKGSGHLIVGGPSVGCMGEPMFISMPGGYDVAICTKKYVNLDGSQPNDTGILPDIKVDKDYEAYLKGKDTQMERAIGELNKMIKAERH